MTTNGISNWVEQQYKVGNSIYDTIEEAMSALVRERQGTSYVGSIEVLYQTSWETKGTS